MCQLPVTVREAQRPPVDEHAHHLLREERVALGESHDALAQGFRHAAFRSPSMRRAVAAAGSGSRNTVRALVRPPPQPGRVSSSSWRAGRRTTMGPSAQRDQEIDEGETAVIGPVDVLEDERPAGRRRRRRTGCDATPRRAPRAGGRAGGRADLPPRARPPGPRWTTGTSAAGMASSAMRPRSFWRVTAGGSSSWTLASALTMSATAPRNARNTPGNGPCASGGPGAGRRGTSPAPRPGGSCPRRPSR